MLPSLRLQVKLIEHKAAKFNTNFNRSYFIWNLCAPLSISSTVSNSSTRDMLQGKLGKDIPSALCLIKTELSLFITCHADKLFPKERNRERPNLGYTKLTAVKRVAFEFRKIFKEQEVHSFEQWNATYGICFPWK